MIDWVLGLSTPVDTWVYLNDMDASVNQGISAQMVLIVQSVHTSCIKKQPTKIKTKPEKTQTNQGKH